MSCPTEMRSWQLQPIGLKSTCPTLDLCFVFNVPPLSALRVSKGCYGVTRATRVVARAVLKFNVSHGSPHFVRVVAAFSRASTAKALEVDFHLRMQHKHLGKFRHWGWLKWRKPQTRVLLDLKAVVDMHLKALQPQTSHFWR